ncbi:MAG: hypothetical protein IJU51_04710 [Clostridia bacterium]|nr:hypothetical protein [Clostridia bacterium]
MTLYVMPGIYLKNRERNDTAVSNTIKLPRCPYCHKKIGYIGSMFMKTKGEHNCSSCKCISNVVISRGAYALASAVCIVALLIVVLYTLGGDHGSYMGIACVLAPFIIFYITIPFFVKLIPCKDKSAVNKILEKRASAMPNETALEAIQNAAKPVTLDVEDDFSARFMKAKKSNIEKNGFTDQEYQPADGEPEDIGNTKIDFEITQDRITEGDDFTDGGEEQDPGEPADDVYENAGEYNEENYGQPEEYSGEENYEVPGEYAGENEYTQPERYEEYDNSPEGYEEEYNYEQPGEYAGEDYETDDSAGKYRNE